MGGSGEGCQLGADTARPAFGSNQLGAAGQASHNEAGWEREPPSEADTARTANDCINAGWLLMVALSNADVLNASSAHAWS